MVTTSNEETGSGELQALRERLDDVWERINQAAQRGGGSGRDVVLIAVTKYASMDQVRALLHLGHQDLGESRVQQLVQRQAQVQEYLDRHHELARGRDGHLPRQARWHMIGHVQRNKVRKILPIVRLIHTVDSLRLAEELQTAAAKRDEPVEILIQINIANEKQKHGIAPAAARHLVDQIDTMMHLRPRGVMAMAPVVEDPQDARQYFELARETFLDVRRAGSGGERFDILSMGMSHDFEVAVECGANVVRVGSALFGEGQGEGEAEAEDD